MANNLFQQLTQSQSFQNSNILQMMQAAKNSGNPMQMLTNMAKNDSTVASVLREVQANGGDAKSLFFQKAQQLGIDPRAVLSQL